MKDSKGLDNHDRGKTDATAGAAKRLQYLNFVIEPEFLERIDDWRFKHRFPTRAAAVKFLLKAALQAGEQRALRFDAKSPKGSR